MNSSGTGTACGNYRIEQESYFGGRSIRAVGRGAVVRDVVGEVVVVFYWLQCDGFTEETKVVYWDWIREEGLYCYCFWLDFLFPLFKGATGSKGIRAYHQAFLDPNEEPEQERLS